MNISRLSRKNWTNSDIGYMHSGGMLDMFDNHFKTIFRINDKEFDYIAETSTDDESEILISEANSFSKKRILLNFLLKKLNEFYTKAND